MVHSTTCAPFWKTMLGSSLDVRLSTVTTFQPVGGWCGKFAALMTLAPLMYHTASEPLVYCQRRSETPSPLKSPTPTSFQAAASTLTGTITCPVTVTPFRHQIATCSVDAFCRAR